EDLLHHHQAPARRGRRAGLPGRDLPAWGGKLDPLAHGVVLGRGAPLCGRQAFRPRLRRERAAGRAAGSAAAGCGYNRAPRARHRRSRPPAVPELPMSVHNPKVGFVSLGCPKALVDSERILTQLRVEGYDIVPTYDDADVV